MATKSKQLEPLKFIRKPIIVEGIEVTRTNLKQVSEWCGGTLEQTEPKDGTSRQFVRVDVKRPLYPRQTQGFPGDWILKTDSGFRVYTKLAFERTFDTYNTAFDAVAASTPSDEVGPGLTD